MISTPELQARLQTVRGHYRISPWILPREDEAPLLRSWQRCRDAGMRENERISFELVSRSLLSTLDDEHGTLVHAARPETERLAQALRGTGSAVLMFNARGVVIDRLCHEAATPTILLHATRKGVNLSERCVGTNAPAIALAEGMPYLVGRDAHFFDNVRPFFCVAAPIDAPDGRRLGALDITSYDQVPGFDVFSLVMDAAAAIENSLFAPGPDRLLVHFHPRQELLGTPMEGLLQVDASGLVTGANRQAARLLCTPRTALQGMAFGALFDRRLHGLFAQPARQRADLVEMQTHVGLQVMARFEGVAAQDGAHKLLGRDLRSSSLAQAMPMPMPASLRTLECQAIERTLAALDGNVSATAKALGISRNTIYRRRQALAGKAG
ncbi:MAG: helix-turn-helix domain-containing protein [Aquabacterium sp.]|nr:helix-turn-helix domain-containing protein [Aquabacterium sp.]